MITSIELYKKFQLKLNKLDSNDNIDVSIGEFVLIYNEYQNKWFDGKFRNISNNGAEEAQQFIVPSKDLLNGTESDNYTEFDLPTNFFDYIRSYVIGHNNTCKDIPLDVFEVKPENVNYYLNDSNNKPSLDYQETFRTLGNNKIQIYRNDFHVDKVILTYYRYPAKIDIAGYTNLDNSNSVNKDPEITDDLYLDEIIDLCVLEAQRTLENPDGFQLSKDRVANP